MDPSQNPRDLCQIYLEKFMVISNYRSLSFKKQKYLVIDKLSNYNNTDYRDVLQVNGYFTYCVQKNKLDAIQYLYENNLMNPENKSQLFKIAIVHGNIDVLKLVIDYGIDVSLDDHFAITVCTRPISNTENIIQLLIDNGADVTSNNNLPIKFAILKGTINKSVLDLLINNGADIHADEYFCAKYAAKCCYIFALKYIINLGIDVNMENGILLKNVLSDTAYSSNEYTYSCIKTLLENGADISFLDDNDTLKMCRGSKTRNILILLLDYGFDISFINEYQVKDSSKLSEINKILDQGIDPIKFILFTNEI
ncbi:putative ankyrin repeat protein [Acanthamoeba castellanii mimivirus]|uniref:Putative ankyrin repeat protein R603 n=6 Tax=Mimivirus TaxID=315393 RepID=YR603_MIMIV|nr:putative ankyrin repeat protein [Acanthamoeba polyphaga mimivirus]Q5UP60.1 RecName: Full=Putative ankyrin repeat protein R603 [Acanthamoeba polyphaga mimivirus]ALR84191.1 ankyrin repeat protein [Niemeyer virus]AMZ03046.1 putative ankyrin repeat protein [Mimivirus Bombay]BAV61718.1 putative ankyrin repeat protein [Acanthamoeba castellanii mimivirus]AAV50866.1 ankyrin containing protein [Acanthamoeba polyphaga mimivirus]ADO18735.1 putative ankyrin repeat protein [Acanthamoeba polyphaga mimiv